VTVAVVASFDNDKIKAEKVIGHCKHNLATGNFNMAPLFSAK
jgi:hypothetical protein